MQIGGTYPASRGCAMPELVYAMLVGMKAAGVRYFTNSSEEMHLCFSSGRLHGPAIDRDGKGPPRMHLAERPWEITTDPILQRLGTWFIDPPSRNSFLSWLRAEVRSFDEKRQAEYKKRKCLDRFEKTADYLSTYFRSDEWGSATVGLQSFGDLTMNQWNVAYIREGLCTSGSPELLYVPGERIDERIYTCVVKWKANQPDAPSSGNEGEKKKVSIESLRFGRFDYDADPTSPDGVRLIRAGNKGIADQLCFAASGQLLISNRELVEPREIVHQFSDIRHLLALPNLNPDGPLYKDEQVELDSKRPRYYFGSEQDDDIWFGEAELLEDRNLRRAALSGPVELSRLYEGLGASKEQVAAALSYRTMKVSEGNYTSRRSYCEGSLPPAPLSPGEWRFVVDDPTLVEVWLKPNIYPCSILGVTEKGDTVCFAWRGNYTDRPGYTIREAAQAMLPLGVTDAILLDEGQDVRHNYLDGQEWREIVPGRREQMRAMFVFTNASARSSEQAGEDCTRQSEQT